MYIEREGKERQNLFCSFLNGCHRLQGPKPAPRASSRSPLWAVGPWQSSAFSDQQQEVDLKVEQPGPMWNASVTCTDSQLVWFLNVLSDTLNCPGFKYNVE